MNLLTVYNGVLQLGNVVRVAIIYYTAHLETLCSDKTQKWSVTKVAFYSTSAKSFETENVLHLKNNNGNGKAIVHVLTAEVVLLFTICPISLFGSVF